MPNYYYVILGSGHVLASVRVKIVELRVDGLSTNNPDKVCLQALSLFEGRGLTHDGGWHSAEYLL